MHAPGRGLPVPRRNAADSFAFPPRTVSTPPTRRNARNLKTRSSLRRQQRAKHFCDRQSNGARGRRIIIVLAGAKRALCARSEDQAKGFVKPPHPLPPTFRNYHHHYQLAGKRILWQLCAAFAAPPRSRLKLLSAYMLYSSMRPTFVGATAGNCFAYSRAASLFTTRSIKFKFHQS